ncbi:MAG: lmo0937 family membrane protein [Gemmataceae bacterium]|nr:lmo0937 family membrane protein [Gemmataceae bacterium]
MRRYSLETIILILVIVWLLGMLVPPFAAAVGSLIHLLLVAILIVVLIRLLRGDRIF